LEKKDDLKNRDFYERDPIDKSFLNQACLTELVYGGSRMLVSDYTLQAIIAEYFVNALRIGCKRRPESSLINKNYLAEIDIFEDEDIVFFG
jgi:hypothetical protein